MSETTVDVAVGHAGRDQAGRAGTIHDSAHTVVIDGSDRTHSSFSSETSDSGVVGVVTGRDDRVGFETEYEYEYTTVQAPRRLEWVYRDAYRHLGWLLDAFDPEGCRNPALVTLRFRRDLALPGRAALAGLQQECDEALAVIAARERVRNSLVHSSTALSGIVGAALVAGAALTLDDGDLLTPVLLVALGVVVWLIGVIGRRHLAEIAAARFGLGIEKEYAVVLRSGEQAAQLLAEAVAGGRRELVPAQP